MTHWDHEHLRHTPARSANASPLAVQRAVEAIAPAVVPALTRALPAVGIGMAGGGGDDDGGSQPAAPADPNTSNESNQVLYDGEAPAPETVYQASVRTAAEHAVKVVNVGGRYPYRARCSCGWETPWGYVAEHAAADMGKYHQEEFEHTASRRVAIAHDVEVINVGGRYPYKAKCSCGWETPWGYVAEHAAADMGKYHQEEHTASRRHVAFTPGTQYPGQNADCVKVVKVMDGGIQRGSNAICYDCKWIGPHTGYSSARSQADAHAWSNYHNAEGASGEQVSMQTGEFDRLSSEWRGQSRVSRTASAHDVEVVNVGGRYPYKAKCSCGWESARGYVADHAARDLGQAHADGDHTAGRTAALADWFQVDDYLWELFHQSGFKAYAEDDLDSTMWWVENDGGDVVDSGGVEGSGDEQMNQAKTLAEDSLGSMSHYSVKMGAAWHIPWQEEYDGGLFCNLTDGGQAVIHPLGSDAALGTFWTGFVNDPSGREVFTTEGYDKVKVSQELSDYVRDHALHEGSTRRTASRRTASTLWDSISEPRHRVAGWNWDDHLAGFVAESVLASFACICGSNVEAPGLHTCTCGKIWNGSLIQTKSGERLVCREVPNRGAEVVLANRRTAAWRDIPEGRDLPEGRYFDPDTRRLEYIDGDEQDWHGGGMLPPGWYYDPITNEVYETDPT